MPKKSENCRLCNSRIKVVLVFILVLFLFSALIFSMSYLDDYGIKKVKADVLAFFEDFNNTAYFDSGKSSGVWDTTTGQAYLPSNVWAGISEEYIGYESLTGFPVDSVRQHYVLDSDNNAYLVWQNYSGFVEYVYFSKFIEGQGWLKMNNNPGYEQIAVGSVPSIYLDSNQVVYILWGVWGPEYKVQITKWIAGVGWAKMDGTPGIDTIYTNTEGGGDPKLQFDNDNRPMVTFPGYNRLLFTKWNGSAWVKMAGTPGYDDLGEGGMNLREFAIDDSNFPYIVWEGLDMSDIYNYYNTVNFIKWNGATWTGADGIDRDSDPTTFENDVLIKLPDIPEPLFPQVKLDANYQPLVSWVRGKVYFSRWNGNTWTGADNVDKDGDPLIYNHDIIDPSADFVSDHSMQLDSDYYPIIVFSESSNNDITFSRWNGITWTGVEKIDRDNDSSTFEYDNISNTEGWSMGSSFVIDSADKIHVVWLENVNNENVYIYFTYWDGIKWAKLSDDVAGKEELFSGIYPGANPPNIKLDSESNPYVFFDSWRWNVGGIYVTKMVTDYIRNASVFSLNVNQTSDYVSIASIKPSDNLFGQSISYFLSNNGGTTWMSVLPNLPYFFSSVGSDLRWKANFHTDNNKVTPQLLDLDIINKTTDFACWSDDPVNIGSNANIYAKITFPASQVKARIVRNDGYIIRDNIPLTSVNGSDYSGSFLVNADFLNSRNVVVFADNSDTNQQTFCNASSGAVWKHILNQNLVQADKNADLISFNNKLWLIGGIKNNVLTNEVFSSVDGEHWICEYGNDPGCVHPAPGWSARWGNKLVVYNKNIWLVGGCTALDPTFSNCPAFNRKNDVWSFDGDTWILKTGSADFSGRFEMAIAEYDNKIWVLGGKDDNNLNDVWHSTDGITWISAPAANWSARYGANAVNYDNGQGDMLWVIGGMDDVGSKTDVWAVVDPLSIDNWLQITSDGGWGTRYGYNFINYDERLIIAGGCNISGVFNGNCDSGSFLNDIWWSIDGENWVRILPTQAWPARFLASSCIFNNHIYIRGGNSVSGALNDIWRSDYGYFSFTIRDSGGSVRFPEPTNFACKDMTSSNITWSFLDNASDEDGFKLYNVNSEGNSSVSKIVNSQNITVITQNELMPNAVYKGFVTAYKGTTESGSSNTDSCYTLANNPKEPIIIPTLSGINISINRSDGNPDYTVYALYEYFSNKYVQPDGSLGSEPVWAIYSVWGGSKGIDVTLSGSYNFHILAKNVAGKIAGYDAAALNLSCKALSPSEIEWKMSAPLNLEMDGFNLYKDTDGLEELVATKAIAESKLYNFLESGLLPNSPYLRYFKTYKVSDTQKVESESSVSVKCFTLAKDPLPIIIGEVTENSVQLILDNGDGNPPETLYAMYEGKSGRYVQADGSLGSEPFWQTYEQWGGVDGIYVNVLGSQVTSQFRITLTNVDLSQYEFVAQVKNGDDIVTAEPTAVISASKGVAINLVVNSNTFLGKIASASNGFQKQSVALRLIQEFSIFLNILLLILIIFFGLNLYGAYKYLNISGKIKEKVKYLFLILKHHPAVLFSHLAGRDNNGTYKVSYHRHRELHLNSQKGLKRTVGVLVLKVVILVVLTISLAGLQYASIAQVNYAQDTEDIKVGDKLSYIIRYANTGNSIAKGIVIKDNLDPNLSFVAGSDKIIVNGAEILNSTDNSQKNENDPLIFTAGDLGINQNASITFDALVRDTGVDNEILNSAEIAGYNFNTKTTNIVSNKVITDQVLVEEKPVDESQEPPIEEAPVQQEAPAQPPTPVSGGASTNLLPLAVDDSAQTLINQPVEIAVLANDSDPENQLNPATFVIVIQPQKGTASIDPNNLSIIYTPNADYVGEDVIKYRICDSVNQCAEARVLVTVNAVESGEVKVSLFRSFIGIMREDVSKTNVGEQALANIAKNETVKAIIESQPVQFAQDKVFNNPVVEQVSQDVVTPALVTVSVINTAPAIATAGLNFGGFLHFIFVEPLLILFRRKRKNWGVVYDSLTKMPISLALVRLYRKEDRRLVQTKVTDRDGRYLIMVKDPGVYYLEVTKLNYDYPTKILGTEKTDTKYLDLYHGEEMTIQDKEAAVSVNIPLDVRDKKVKPISLVIRSFALQNLKNVISYVGLILAVLVLFIYPSIITIAALLFHIIFYVTFRKLLVPAKPKGWGIVYDEQTKQNLNNVVVRLFDIKFNKLLETQLTDSRGRYAFLVGKNVYQILAEKDGYQSKEIKPVDLTTNEELVNLDIALAKPIEPVIINANNEQPNQNQSTL